MQLVELLTERPDQEQSDEEKKDKVFCDNGQ